MEQTLLFIIAGLFFLGGVVIFVNSFITHDKTKTQELWTIYFTEFVIVGLILVPAYIGGLTFVLVMTLIGLVALWELYGLVEVWTLYGLQGEKFPLVFKLIGLIAGIAIFASAYWFNGPEAMYMIVPIASIILLSSNIFVAISPTTTAHLGLAQVGVIYPCLLFAHIVLIGNRPDGFMLIAFLYVVVEMNDAFALLFGKLWGCRLIFPRLSPKKTIEGSLSGMVCALLMAIGLSWLMPQFTWIDALVGGTLIVLFTILGDLAASKLKRDVGVKDFGNVLPKQGGVLDIYDSLIFAAPLFYWYINL